MLGQFWTVLLFIHVCTNSEKTFTNFPKSLLQLILVRLISTNIKVVHSIRQEGFSKIFNETAYLTSKAIYLNKALKDGIIAIWERASVSLVPSFVWCGPLMGIEPRISCTRSQHSTTRLSRQANKHRSALEIPAK